MKLRRRTLVVAAASVMAVGGGTGAALAVTGGPDGANGPDADQAVTAALDLTGGGTANAVERDDEKGATWEVEVTRPDGSTVDVRLDSAYQLVAIDGDSETADGPDSNDAGETESAD